MRKNSGQALLIILLIMAVGLTVGLAVISRSVTDIGISRQEEESARVFSVAEAGIEEALRLGYAPAGAIEMGGITATVSQTNLGKTQEFSFPGEYEVGDIQTLWLVEHKEDGTLDTNNKYSAGTIDVYWGKGGGITPALEVTLIYDQSGVKIMRWALDPDVSRRSTNNFDSADSGNFQIGGKTFKYKKSLSSLPCPSAICYALRLRLLYNNEPQILGAKGTSNLPSQGICYESTANNPQTGITRKVRQCQFYKTPPGIFDYVLYSEGNLVK
jgi:hypothetical protein